MNPAVIIVKNPPITPDEGSFDHEGSPGPLSERALSYWRQPKQRSRPARAPWLLLGSLLLLACDGATERETRSVPLPLQPVQLSYRYWDHHLIQWLPDSSPYETIEAMIDESTEPPTIHFFYTEREARDGSKKQYHYGNTESLIASICVSAGDRECRQADIDYEYSESDTGPSFHISLQTAAGSVDWQFVSEGTPSEQYAAGLIDNAEAGHDLRGGVLVFYLAESALSSATSVVAIGDESYPIQPWEEVSQEPYFTAYHGAYSRGVHQGYLPAYGPIRASELETPIAYEQGATWRYRMHYEGSDQSEEQNTALAKREGNTLIFERDSVTITALLQADALMTQSVSIESLANRMAVTFNPPLPEFASMETGEHESSWSLAMAGNEAMMSGTITAVKDGAELRVRFDPQAPAWTVPLGLNTVFNYGADGLEQRAETFFPEGP